jgi:tRNA(adenine34) deaminase
MEEEDAHWMGQALALARHAAASGEVPVGAVVVKDGVLVGQGWNQPIGASDPTAHAEILALRDAGQNLANYRLIGTTLYCTLEPCAMCVGAIVHARVARLVFAASDPKGGACGGRIDLLPSHGLFNHRPQCSAGIFAEESGDLLREFFRVRR